MQRRRATNAACRLDGRCAFQGPLSAKEPFESRAPFVKNLKVRNLLLEVSPSRQLSLSKSQKSPSLQQAGDPHSIRPIPCVPRAGRLSASMPRAILLVLGIGVAFLEPHGVSAFAPSAMMRLGHRRISASQRPSQRTSLRMCLGEKPPGQENDEKNPLAAGGEDDGGPLAGVFRFAMQPITLPLVGSVATVFAGSLVMTLSLAFVVVHWAVSPPTDLALGGTPPPGIARTEQRQVVLSQKAVLFEEVPPACRCRDSPLCTGPWVCTALRWASGGSVQKREALRRRFGPGMVFGVWWLILRHGTQPRLMMADASIVYAVSNPACVFINDTYAKCGSLKKVRVSADLVL